MDWLLATLYVIDLDFIMLLESFNWWDEKRKRNKKTVEKNICRPLGFRKSTGLDWHRALETQKKSTSLDKSSVSETHKGLKTQQKQKQIKEKKKNNSRVKIRNIQVPYWKDWIWIEGI